MAILYIVHKMKIVHIAEFEHTKDNGIKGVVLTLQCEQEKLGSSVYIFNISSQNQKVVKKDELSVCSTSCFKHNINALQPDVVIFHSVYKPIYISFSRFLRKKNILYLIEPHGGTSTDNAKKSYLKKRIANLLLFNHFFAKAKGVIYLNEYEREKCVFKDIRKAAFVIPNGIYPPSGDISTAHKPKNKIHFTFLARIDIHHKGIDILLDAISILSKTADKDDYIFNFYGSSSNKKDIIYLKNRLKTIGNNLFYHGSVWGEQKEQALTNTNIYVLTSRNEGMPLSVLEALSCGCPCVITPQTNMQNIIENNHSGWVVQSDSKAIAEVLSRAIKEYRQKQDVYTHNAIMSVQYFTWDFIAKKAVCEYSKALNK